MWGTVTIGGIALREEINAEQDGQVISIAGQESFPPQSRASVLAAHDNLTAMDGLVVPVVFTDKEELSGFFRVSSARSDLLNYANGSYLSASWAATLTRLGGPRDLEVESVIPRIARTDTLAGVQVPVFWHAPAVGALDYFTGSTLPTTTISRDGREGVVKVYAGLPAGTEPRWTIAAEDYMAGATRLTINGRGRIGALTPPVVDDWTVENGLIRLTPTTTGRVVLECWDAAGDEWVSARTLVFAASGTLTATPELTVMRNEPEEVIVRLTYPQTGAGRVTVDLGMRRGSRFITGTIKRHSAATLAVNDGATFAGTAVTGGVRQTAADADGNRAVLGSAMNPFVNAGVGAIASAAPVTRFDFFAGHEVGSSPASGDAFADLLAQYLGSTGELMRVVKRG